MAVVYKTQGPEELHKALEALDSFAEGLEALGVVSGRPDEEEEKRVGLLSIALYDI